mgnify:CR=1 FL=1
MGQFTFTVPPDFDGQTVQNFLRQGCGLSWRMVVKLKRVENGITVDGVHRRSIDRVCAGQTVAVLMPTDAVRIESADIPLTVAYEDPYLLIVDKPPGLAVHPSAGKPEPTLANAVVGYFEKQGEPLSFRPVSRLDRNTSGLLPVAKSAHIAYALTGKITKTYLAIVVGELTGSGTVDQPIRVREGSCITREVGEGGKNSVTHWRALATDGSISVLRVQIETGRTHQIRVHLSHLGYPLVGDTMYGTDETLPRHALHCARLQFVHPITEKETDIRAPLPTDLENLLSAHHLHITEEDYLDDQSMCF